MTVVGFDFSTMRIDWAWVQQGEPQRARVELVEPEVIDRVKAIRGLHFPPGMTDACIEMPWGPNQSTTRKLMAVVGALTCRVPMSCRVSWIDPRDLRAAIGAKDTKDSAHAAVRARFPGVDFDYGHLQRGWDEHELDALVACLGWTAILNLQEM